MMPPTKEFQNTSSKGARPTRARVASMPGEEGLDAVGDEEDLVERAHAIAGGRVHADGVPHLLRKIGVERGQLASGHAAVKQRLYVL